MNDTLPERCPAISEHGFRCTDNAGHTTDHVHRAPGVDLERWANSSGGVTEGTRFSDGWPLEDAVTTFPNGVDLSITVSPDGTVFISLNTRPDSLDSPEPEA